MKKRISALLLSVVLCLGMLSVTASASAAIRATGTAGENTISITGVDGEKLCALWGDSTFHNLLLLFYTDNRGNATITVDAALNTNDVYYVGVQGEATAQQVTIASAPAPNGGSSSSSNGGSSSNVTVSSASNGKVTFSPSNPRRGDTVTLTVTPDDGYQLDSLTVTDSKGSEIALTKVSDTQYTFTMPSGRVTVKPVFVERPAPIAFTDVPSGAFYADAVQWAVEQGITTGTSATTFSPEDPCTRAQIVTFLWRAAGCPAVSSEIPFTDVVSGSYYADAVQWAVEQGVTKGTSATTFDPEVVCTRAQTVTFLYRYAGSPAVSGENPFTDVEEDMYYTAAVQWAVDSGVTKGTGADAFSPDAICSRGQIVTFLYRDLADPA